MQHKNITVSEISQILERANWFDSNHYLATYLDIHNYPSDPILHFIEHGVTELRVPKAGSLLPKLRQVFSQLIRTVRDFPYTKDDSQHFFQWVRNNLTLIQKLEDSLNIASGSLPYVIHMYHMSGAAPSQKPLFLPHAHPSDEDAFFAILFFGYETNGAIDLLFRIDELSRSEIDRDVETVKTSGLFDTEYYLTRYPDIREHNVEPIRHYLEYGALERRDPSGEFSTEFYLSDNFDVLQAGINPLLHYISYGRQEGRNPQPGIIDFARNSKIERSHHRVALVNSISNFIRTAALVKVITFDFFDTLVERRNSDPAFIFTLMQQSPLMMALGIKDFRTLRINAESRARQVNKGEVRLSEIYDELSQYVNIKKRDLANLITLEKSVERENLIARPVGIALFEHARKSGARLGIVSDFYIGADFLKEVCKHLKIDLDGINVFVSCDFRKTKHEGSLFGHVARHYRVSNEMMLHVGDNEHSDYNVPLSRGLLACHLPHTQFVSGVVSEVDRYLRTTTTEHSVHNFTRIARSAYEKQKSILASTSYSREAREFGYKILGPVVLSFARYLDKILESQETNNALFLSRDTKLIYEVFSNHKLLFKNAREYDYLLCSRQCIFGLASVDYNEVKKVIYRDYQKLSFIDMLRNRFLFDDSDIKKLEQERKWLRGKPFYTIAGSMYETADLFYNYATRIYKDISQVALRRKVAYENYIAGIVKSRSMIVDIGYRGTTQIAFQALLNRPMNATYFMTWPEAKAIRSYGLAEFSFIESDSQLQVNLTKHVSLLELVLSDPNGESLRNFEMDQKTNSAYPVFGKNDLGASQREYLNIAHNSALNFISDHSNLLTMIMEEGEREHVMLALINFFESPPQYFTEVFSNAVFEDVFGGASAPLLN
jgi:FMN phosphatase YigB (HAD superfamily)